MNKIINRTPALYHRINITLPQETLRLLDKVAEKGDRSRLVNDAVRFYVEETSKANLQKMMQKGALARAERDLGLVQDWFHVENEAWQKNKK